MSESPPGGLVLSPPAQKLTSPLPAPFLPYDVIKKARAAETLNLFSQACARVIEKGYPELYHAFDQSMTSYETSTLEALQQRIRDLEAQCTKMEDKSVISEDKLKEIRSEFETWVDEKYKDNEAAVVAPLEARIQELETQLQASMENDDEVGILQAKIEQVEAAWREDRKRVKKWKATSMVSETCIVELEQKIQALQAETAAQARAREEDSVKMKTLENVVEKQKVAMHYLKQAIEELQ